MHFGHERLGVEDRTEEVVEVDRQQAKQAIMAGGRDRVRCVVPVGPSRMSMQVCVGGGGKRGMLGMVRQKEECFQREEAGRGKEE